MITYPLCQFLIKCLLIYAWEIKIAFPRSTAISQGFSSSLGGYIVTVVNDVTVVTVALVALVALVAVYSLTNRAFRFRVYV